jgi:hypothetical protein
MMGGHCPADEHRRLAPTGERARWDHSAPDDRLGWAPSSPLRSLRNPRRRVPRLGPPSKPELRPRCGRCLLSRSLLSLLFLHPRRSIRQPDACDFTVAQPAVSSRRTRAAAVALSRLSLPRRKPDPMRRPRGKSIKSNFLIHLTFSVENCCKQRETLSKICKFSRLPIMLRHSLDLPRNLQFSIPQINVV